MNFLPNIIVDNYTSKVIKNNTINFIDVLYIEFHSQYMHGALAQITKSREKKIIQYIKSNTNIGLRLWD